MSVYTSALLLAWIAIAILAFAMSGLLRQLHLIRAALDPEQRMTLGPPRGVEAPALNGNAGVGWRRPAILLFMEAECPGCRGIQQELGAVTDGAGFDVVAVFRGESEGELPDGVAVATGANEAFRKYNISFTPFAVSVNSDGRVAAAEPLGSVGSLHRFVDSQRERMGT